MVCALMRHVYIACMWARAMYSIRCRLPRPLRAHEPLDLILLRQHPLLMDGSLSATRALASTNPPKGIL